MERSVSASRACLAVMAGLTALAQGAPVRAQSSAAPVELVSVAIDGGPGNHHSGSDGLVPPRDRISADGRYVVFESYASTLVCSDADFSTRDVFVRDRLTGRTTVVSVAAGGGEANGNSFDPSISADGRYVAFSSEASNLVPGDTNVTYDVFLRDLQAGTTTRLSVSSAGEQANSSAYGADLSADGRYATFYSGASNLVPDDTNNRWDIFVRDVAAGTTERVSVSTAGLEASCCDSLYPSISADGRYVAFLSQGRLDPSALNNFQEIYIRDRSAGTTTIVRTAADGGLSSTGIRFADLSANGRSVAFQSNSDNIVVPDQNGFIHDVFVKDLATGTTTLVSQSTDGTQGNRDSWMPSISADGRYIAFYSWANNLVPGDTNTQPFYDVFVRDTQLGTTTRVNLTPEGGESNGSSTAPSISADGRLVLFESTATNLVPNDINGFPDVFLAGQSYPGGGGTSVQFASTAGEALESAAVATVTVTRHGPFCSSASVQYATADGTATAGADYTPASGTLTFAVGQGSKTFDVPLLNDALEEPGETIQLALSNPTGGLTLGTPSTASLTIVDDDTPENRPPDAVDDTAATLEDLAVSIAVRANDSDPDGDPLSITDFTQGAHGAVADGGATLIYTPSANFNGTDTFHYTIGDGGGLTDTATVHVTVAPVNDAPVAAADQYTTARNSTLTVAAPRGVLANDSDPDRDALTAALLDPPGQAALALAADGSFTLAPAEGFSGPVTFTYRARDSQTASAPTTVTVIVQPSESLVSSCRPVTAAALHRIKPNGVDFMGEPFLGNRRLTPLGTGGTVPCVEVDTMEATRCPFWTGDPVRDGRIGRKASGPWVEDAEGRVWVVVGQPVTRDGSLSAGSFIVGTEPDADGSAPCLAASGNDVAGSPAPSGSDMIGNCMLEVPGGSCNASGRFLRNVATRLVGTTSSPHPDGAQQVSFDPVSGIGWYTGEGAALNDGGGAERDGAGIYFGEDWACHIVMAGGIQVPAAKRPAARSYPAPGQVNFDSPIIWRVFNPYVEIANSGPFDPRVGLKPVAKFTPTVTGNTLSLDASATQGEILEYGWDLEWTTRKPDSNSTSPTAAFPFVLEDVPPQGSVLLTVLARDGQTDSVRRRVYFRPAPVAQFTWAVGINTLWLDASASQGDIVQYSWDLEWTTDTNPDGAFPSPTAEFPIAFQGVPPRTGWVKLIVTARDGQKAQIRQQVTFRSRNPFPGPANAAPGN